MGFVAHGLGIQVFSHFFPITELNRVQHMGWEDKYTKSGMQVSSINIYCGHHLIAIVSEDK